MNPAANQRDHEDFEAKIWSFLEQGTLPSVIADEKFLCEIGLFTQIESAPEECGWKGLLSLTCATNLEDTCEFLASLELKGKYLRYRHRGVYYEVTTSHLKRAFGWTTSARDEEDQSHVNVAWSALTWSNKTFRAGRSLGSEMCKPLYYYLHRLFSHTVLARHAGSQWLGVLDMTIMKGVVFGFKVKFVRLMAEHWTKVRPTEKFTAGGMITYFLRAMHGTDHLEGQTVIQSEYLTRAKMIKMKGLREFEGELQCCFEGFMVMPIGHGVPFDEGAEALVGRITVRRRTRASVREQEQQVALVRNPRGATAEQTQADYAQPEEVAQEYPWMDPDYIRQWMFNTERVLEYCAPAYVDNTIEPPADWMPGMSIPYEFQIYDEDEA